MTEPTIGDPTGADPGECAYSTKPGDPYCGQPATTHVLSESAIYGPVSLPTCDQHAGLARAAGLLMDEHPFSVGCDSRWTLWGAGGCEPTVEDVTA